ncbi:MAG: hypothetical protein K8963_09975, partial [Proteobacteria bacterium]|nr:hypothetical protein [Pseudomonadota bacterium]
MSRPVSPLRHDYKPNRSAKPSKPMAFKWFAVGVGIPLLALGLLRLQSNDAPALPIQVKMQASAGAVVEIPAITPDIPVEEIILLAPQPKPLFDTLLLEVSSGDTMERLF